MKPQPEHAAFRPPAAEVEAAFEAIPAEARAALWLRLVDGATMSDVAEVIGISLGGAALVAVGGAAAILERLRRRGWAVGIEDLAGLLAALPPVEPPPGFEERIRARFAWYLSREDQGDGEEAALSF